MKISNLLASWFFAAENDFLSTISKCENPVGIGWCKRKSGAMHVWFWNMCEIRHSTKVLLQLDAIEQEFDSILPHTRMAFNSNQVNRCSCLPFKLLYDFVLLQSKTTFRIVNEHSMSERKEKNQREQKMHKSSTKSPGAWSDSNTFSKNESMWISCSYWDEKNWIDLPILRC